MAETHLPKLTVVLGAGASYGIADPDGTEIKDAGWQPPLANELFGPRPAFEGLLDRYPGAAMLGAKLRALSRSNGLEIEKELRKYADSHDPNTQRLFKEVPFYLRDVVLASQTGYARRPTNYDHLLPLILGEVPHEVCFVVMNYDTLLEQALGVFTGGNPEFRTFDDYIVGNPKFQVIKPHGSITWGIPMCEDLIPWAEGLANFFPKRAAKPRVFPDALASTDSTTWTNRIGTENGPQNVRLFPAITAPVAGKARDDVLCPDGHKKSLYRFLSSCHKILIIGCSGLDEDLLDLLRTGLGSQGWAAVQIADPQAKTAWNEFRKVPSLGLASKYGFSEESLVESTFHDFLDPQRDSLIPFLRLPV